MSASSKKKLRKEQQALQMTEKQLKEQKEAKKTKIYTIAFVTAMAIILVAFLGSIVYNRLDETGFFARHDTVLEVNDHDINAVELNYFYIDAISNQYNAWYSEYQNSTPYMLTMYGLDIYKPLNQSYYDTEGKVTWADMFANQAVQDAIEIYTLYDAAKAEGHKLTEEEKQNVEEILHNIEHSAIDGGFASLGEYLTYMYGNGARKSSYRDYLNVLALANSYRNAHAEALSYGEADYTAYLAEHPNDYSNFSYTVYQLRVSDFYQGGTKDEATGTTTYSDEEKAAAEAACKAATDSIAAAKPTNAEGLNAAIASLSIYQNASSEGSEGSSVPTATVNEDVAFAYLSTYYKDWLGDASRKSGDFTIVPITEKAEDGTDTGKVIGYYAVIFDGRDDFMEDTVTIRHILVGFEGGTVTNGVTTYTDAEKQATKQKAEEILAQFNATGKTEDEFAAMVEANTDDGGSMYNGGLYSHVLEGQMVDGFNDWIFDAKRNPGDCEIVETEFGYHLIYFVEKDELNYRDYMVDSTLRTEATQAWLKEKVDATKVGERDISKLDLDFTIAPSSAY